MMGSTSRIERTFPLYLLGAHGVRHSTRRSSGQRWSATHPSSGAVLHLAEAANVPCTLCAEGSSTGAASASADIATLPPGFIAANFSTGTIFVSAGAEADPSVAGAVSTDDALAPTSEAALQRHGSCLHRLDKGTEVGLRKYRWQTGERTKIKAQQ